MILLGLLLMLACAALAVDAVVQNTAVIPALAFNQPISHLSLGAIFIAGTVVGVLFALGLALFTGGIGRTGRARRERRAAERETAAETQALRADNERLASRLAEHERAADAYPGEPAERDATRREVSGGRHRLRG